MDYNKEFELGPWPMNLLLCIFEENDWDVLKKKLPRDYRGTLEYMLLTRFGQRPAEIIRMVFQEGLSGVGITTAKEIAKALREAGFVYYGGEDE